MPSPRLLRACLPLVLPLALLLASGGKARACPPGTYGVPAGFQSSYNGYGYSGYSFNGTGYSAPPVILRPARERYEIRSNGIRFTIGIERLRNGYSGGGYYAAPPPPRTFAAPGGYGASAYSGGGFPASPFAAPAYCPTCPPGR